MGCTLYFFFFAVVVDIEHRKKGNIKKSYTFVFVWKAREVVVYSIYIFTPIVNTGLVIHSHSMKQAEL